MAGLETSSLTEKSKQHKRKARVLDQKKTAVIEDEEECEELEDLQGSDVEQNTETVGPKTDDDESE